jgi:NDP-sugar pyrophosphorylase family protein
MNIVITMAGLGARFRDAGYTVPKYRIEAHGRTLFEWAMMSLDGYYDRDNRYIFVVRAEDGARDFISRAGERLGFERIEIVEIDYLTDGQATTAALALPHCEPGGGLLVYNIDTLVKPGAMNGAQLRGDGFIPCFAGAGDHWSFVRLGADGRATAVTEKARISDHCTLGAYYFKTARLYRRLYDDFYGKGADGKSERFIAPMYQYLIDSGGDVYITDVAAADVFVLGTPGELEHFNAHFAPVKEAFLAAARV